jgi:hypothetical protein
MSILPPARRGRPGRGAAGAAVARRAAAGVFDVPRPVVFLVMALGPAAFGVGWIGAES